MCVYIRTLNWTHPQVSETLQFSKFNECLLCSASQIWKVKWKTKVLFYSFFTDFSSLPLLVKKGGGGEGEENKRINPCVQKFVTDTVVLCCVKESEANFGQKWYCLIKGKEKKTTN